MAPYSPHDRKANGSAAPQGPHPSVIQVAKPYVFEQRLQKCMTEIGVTEAKEDTIRLQGVTWIDNVRKALQLWVCPQQLNAPTLTVIVLFGHTTRR